MRGLRGLLPGGAMRKNVVRSRTRRLCVRALSSTAAGSFTTTPLSSSRDLRMWNSLTGRTEQLPRETAATPHVLKWYACGPTVYDHAHLGHARAYVSQDILRRVAERTGGYNVLLVMGVTDVDDKIIARAAERGLPFQQLAREQERTFFEDLARLYVRPPSAVTRVSEHMDEIVAYVAEIERQGFAYEASDGSGVYFHTQQLGDAYGKLDPRRQTQTPHPGSSTGSVVDEETAVLAQAEAEADTDETQTKRDPRDFALWKASKTADEPAWPSPWGPGRPGWHIECSAMTHHVLGDTLDMHTGGVDLRFPHHNNEIAQCEAHNCSQHNHGQNGEWCRHFVHFGHLYIKGRKMSKSLKNFISVRDFLQEGHTADHFRLFCLQFKYRANLHYSPDRVRDAEAVADRIRSFFRGISAYGDAQELASSAVDGITTEPKSKRCEPRDLEMLTALTIARAQVDAALLDDLDTPKALAVLLDLLSKTNVYLLARHGGGETSEAPEEVLQALTDYVLDMLDLFGLEGLHAEFSTMMRRRFALPLLVQEQQRPETHCDDGASPEEQEALLHALIKFRAAVRETALLDPKQPGNARVLTLCDDLRNKELPPLGVQVEDLAPGRSVVKRLTQSEREVLAVEEAEAKATKEAEAKKTTALSQKQREFEGLMQIAPSELFRESPEFAGRFDSFDAEGFPTHEKGEPLTKSQSKKLAKKLQKHEKSYNKYWQARSSTQ